MPYFKWSGIDITGKSRSGKLFCTSVWELDQLLLRRDIALLRCTQARSWFLPRVKSADKVQFFMQLATMLKAGILLPQALIIVSQQTTQVRLAAAIRSCADAIQQGKSFSDSVRQEPVLADTITIALVTAGQETGSLEDAVQAVGDYLLFKDNLYKKFRAVVRLPLITFCCFIISMLTIFTFIIPTFATFIIATEQELPVMTRAMLAVSTLLKSSFFWVCAFGILSMITFLFKLLRRNLVTKRWLDSLFLRLPLIGYLIRSYLYTHFFKTMSFLLAHGVSIPAAIEHATLVMDNLELYQNCLRVQHEVNAGILVSQAFAHYHQHHCSDDILELIATGQESGNLAFMLERGAAICHERFQNLLSWVTLLLQPLLMVIIGLCVALLIFAVYIPFLNLSYRL